MEGSSINTQCTAIIFICLLPSTTNFPEAKLSPTFLSPIFWKIFITHILENIQRLFRLQICLSRKSATTRKYSKTFFVCKFVLAANQQQPENIQKVFACKFVLAANQQQPEKIQRLFRLQTCLSRKSSTTRKYSKTFWAINSSNQQHQPAAATSSNYQQQQSAATSSINQQ